MSVRPIVAVVATHLTESTEAREFLRLVAALVASDAQVRLIETGPGIGAFADENLSDEAESLIEGLAALEVRPERLDDDALGTLLVEAASILRLGARKRSARPTLLEVGDAPPDLAALPDAGQVVRALDRPGEGPRGSSHA